MKYLNNKKQNKNKNKNNNNNNNNINLKIYRMKNSSKLTEMKI